MLTIDENTRALARQNELDVEVGQEVQLAGEFETGCEPIKFENGLETYDVLISPPYRYLGRGREKIVVSANVKGVEELTGAQGSTQLAMGLAWDNRGGGTPKLTGLEAYNYLADTTLPTYPWYLQSLDRKRCLFPDLSQEGTVVSSNTRSLTPKDQERLSRGWESIIGQIRAMISTALETNPPLQFHHDNLYFILRPNDHPHVMLGDFDGSAIFRCPLTEGREKRQIALMRETFADKMERLVEVIDDILPFKLTLFDL